MTPQQLSEEPTSTNLSVDLAGSSHRGHVREQNEDHYLLIQFGRSLETLGTNLDQYIVQQNFDVTGYGMLIADGMGGMAGGEVASSLALSKLVELVLDTPDWFMSLRRSEDAAKVLNRMKERFREIDQAIRQHAEEEITLQGMGTTLTIAATVESDLILGHIGDSRAYLFRDCELVQLTNDHTLAQALIEAGLTSPEDLTSRSMRHVLTSAVGSLGESTPQVLRTRLQPGDRILLCTDGLTDMVDDDTIATVLQHAHSAHGACHDLVDLALAEGGTDNITVIVARFRSANLTEGSD